MKMTACLIPVLAFLAISAPAQVPSAKKTDTPVNVYVAPFSSSDSIDPQILSSLRDLFEESFENAFANNGTYIVLNRETIEKILVESQNEAALSSIDDLSAKAKSGLKIAKADGVIFGAITDDKDSGEIVVSVKLQSFDSVLFWNESASMKRGLIHDRSSRKAAMEQLVNAIPRSGKAASETAGPDSHTGATTTPPAASGGPLLGQKAELCLQLAPNELGGARGCGLVTWNQKQYHCSFPGFFGNGKRLTEPTESDFIVTADKSHEINIDVISNTNGTAIYYRGEVGSDHLASGTWTFYSKGTVTAYGTWTSRPLVS